MCPSCPGLTQLASLIGGESSTHDYVNQSRNPWLNVELRVVILHVKKSRFRKIAVACNPVPGSRVRVFWPLCVSAPACGLVCSEDSVNTCWIREWIHENSPANSMSECARKHYECLMSNISPWLPVHCFIQTDRILEPGVKTTSCGKKKNCYRGPRTFMRLSRAGWRAQVHGRRDGFIDSVF